MNNPTREEFDALKEEVRRLREQITEPMKVTRVEVASADVQNRLDNHTAMMRELDQKVDGLGSKANMHTAAFQRVETVLNERALEAQRFESKMDERFHAMEKRFESIAQVQRLILEKLEGK